jgi:pimeloyl-ACP methyl ester carboxylesterase
MPTECRVQSWLTSLLVPQKAAFKETPRSLAVISSCPLLAQSGHPELHRGPLAKMPGRLPLDEARPPWNPKFFRRLRRGFGSSHEATSNNLLRGFGNPCVNFAAQQPKIDWFCKKPFGTDEGKGKLLSQVDASDNKAFASKGKLTMPILALGAEKLFGEQQAAIMREVGTNVEGGIIANSGHWIMEEQPDATVKAVRAFLDKK